MPVLPSTSANADLDEVREFFERNSRGIMIKALSGGGGRGMRAVRDPKALDDAYRVCGRSPVGIRQFGTVRRGTQ
ncbi:hypothetical protein ACETU7_23745 [Rhodococcus sp. 3Y1]